jgi:hypothetical protein
MALGTFVPPVSRKAGSFDPRDNAGKPLIVIPREFREGFVSARYKDPKDVVIYDVADLTPLLQGEQPVIHVSVITGSGAMVDRLKTSVPADGAEPTKLPVKIEAVTPPGKNTYYTIEPLDPESNEFKLAVAWESKYPTAIDDKRREHQAEMAAQQGTNGNGGGQSAAPLQGIGGNSAPAAAPAPEPEPTKPAGGGLDDDALAKALASLE